MNRTTFLKRLAASFLVIPSLPRIAEAVVEKEDELGFNFNKTYELYYIPESEYINILGGLYEYNDPILFNTHKNESEYRNKERRKLAKPYVEEFKNKLK